MKTVNSLKHIIDCTDTQGNQLNIHIKLDDDCHNGHNDFSITATIWEKDKPRNDRNMICGGCCHDKIVKARPDLKIFVDLHLADVNGAPMYAVANGFYHLKEGFNDTKPTEPTFKKEYCEYYRLTENQFETLRTSEDEQVFAYYLSELGILKQWKEQADEAIKILENWTGEKFKDNSKNLQIIEISNEELKEIERKQKEGYYNSDQIAARAKAKETTAQQNKLNELKEDLNKDIKKHTDEYNVKRAVLLSGLSIDNFIYYNHSNEGVFNWIDASYYKKITQDQFNGFLEFMKSHTEPLPAGITFKIKHL
jgi:hypothetical protein